jgi:hypothetical protein
MEWYLRMVMFVGGLHEKLRDEVLQKNPQTMDEALDEARKQELILKDEKKTRGSQVVAVKRKKKKTSPGNHRRRSGSGRGRQRYPETTRTTDLQVPN